MHDVYLRANLAHYRAQGSFGFCMTSFWRFYILENNAKNGEKKGFIAQRRHVREQAFILIFEKLFSDYEIKDIVTLAQESYETDIPEESEATAQGVYECADELDAIIERYSRARSVSRISRVSLAILRLALYEMKYIDSIEPEISINEAVELAKKFATKEESAFINGILESYRREDK